MNTTVKRAVLILGMHRSGTSALSRVLNLMGVDLGDTLLQPQFDNVTGYWEHVEIYQSNETLLRKIDSSWDDVRPFPETTWEQDASREYQKTIHGIIKTHFSSSTVWGVKDPRICRFIPLWIPVLNTIQVSPALIYIIRNPAEVAESLKRRNGFSHAKSYHLWMRYFLDFEKSTRGMNRIIITYDGLLANPRETIDRIMNKTGLALEMTSDMELSIREYLKTDYRHHDVSSRTTEDIIPSGWLKQVYHASLDLMDGERPDCWSIFDEVNQHLNEMARLIPAREYEVFANWINLLMDKVDYHREEIGALRTDIREQHGRIMNEIGQHRVVEKEHLEQMLQAHMPHIQIRQERENHDAVCQALKKSISLLSAQKDLLKVQLEREQIISQTLATTIAQTHDKKNSVIVHITRLIGGLREWHRTIYQMFLRLVKFDSSFYFANYPDVTTSGKNPFLHFLIYGIREKRKTYPEPNTTYQL